MLRLVSNPIASALARPQLIRAPFVVSAKPATVSVYKYNSSVATKAYATSAIKKTTTTTTNTTPAKEKAATKKKIDDEKKKLASLKQRLTKEKALLKALNKKLSDADKKHTQRIKERRQKELKKKSTQSKKEKQQRLLQSKKEKALQAKAFKKFHKLNAYNFYIRENVSGTVKLADAAKQFKNLSDGERDTYERKANEYNERMAQIFKPKPKQPVFAYAAFLGEQFSSHYEAAGKDNTIAFKNIAQEWKKLTEAEKAKYKPAERASQEYSKQLEAWKADRLKAYKNYTESSGTTVSASA